MSLLITVEALRDLLGTPDLRVADTRFDLANPTMGRQHYDGGHIPGAIFFDLECDLSGPLDLGGGRHPLPDISSFAEELGRRGIGNDQQVVVYDNGTGMFAGRLWWMLRYVGLDSVRVLDGGFEAWLAAGYSASLNQPSYLKSTFIPSPRRSMMVDRNFVLKNLGNKNVLLIDARAGERYRGEVEPIDPVAGHIPGAINLPYEDNLYGGCFLAPEELRQRFAIVKEAEEVVVYCGSGVTATHNLLALEEAGLTGAKLYAGSWSDWVTYEDAPVATGQEWS
jgi:thiosulfate/3-mercaptopyruvate sulfurtransferase